MSEQTTKTENASAQKPRGFAAMMPEQRRAVASSGGKAAHAVGTAHEFTREEARAAGRKGGAIIAQRPGAMAEMGRRGGAAVSADREHMAEIGRRGGVAVAKIPGHMAEIGRRGGTAKRCAREGS